MSRRPNTSGSAGTPRPPARRLWVQAAVCLCLLAGRAQAAGASEPTGAQADPQAQVLGQVHALAGAAAQAASEGQADRAVALMRQAVQVAQAGLGKDHSETIQQMVKLGQILVACGHLVQAEEIFASIAAAVERLAGADAQPLGWVLFRLGEVRLRLDRLALAVGDLERALAIYEVSPQVGLNEKLNLLRILMEATAKLGLGGDLSRPVALGKRLILLAQGVANPGERAWYLAGAYANLARVYGGQLDSAAARAMVELGMAQLPAIPETERAPVQFSLLELQCTDGGAAPRRKEQLCRAALTTGEQAFGPDDPRLSIVACQLGSLAVERGAPAEARPLLERAIALLEKAGKGNTLEIIAALQALAELLDGLGEDQRAEQLFRRSLAVFESAVGPAHIGTANAQRMLANFAARHDRLAEALPLMVQAEACARKVCGPHSPLPADFESDLAVLRTASGDHQQAWKLISHAIAMKVKVFGEKSRYLYNDFTRLTRIEMALGHWQAAVVSLGHAEWLREKRLADLLHGGSEHQKSLLLESLQAATDLALSLHLVHAPQDAQAGQLALQTLLRRKGRLMDVMAGSGAALRLLLNPADRQLLNEVAQLHSQIAVLAGSKVSGAELEVQQREIARLEAQVEVVQGRASLNSAALREELQPATVEAVQALVPEGAVLVEFASYEPMGANAQGYMVASARPRYAAWLLAPRGAPRAVDLGPRDAIDQQIDALRRAMASPNRQDVKELARALDERILRPLRSLLPSDRSTRQLLLAPDGMLHLVPFAALVDESGRWALQNHEISYLAAGRELIRLQQHWPTRSPALIVANPQFADLTAAGSSPKVEESKAASPPSPNTNGLQFSSLPGAEAEGRLVASLLPGAKLLTGGQATEAAVKAARAPAVLHLATHGFFQADAATAAAGGPRRLGENPLLQSGLALAGANHPVRSGEDGLLSGLEAANLDLWGTELVVLSACETGVGQVRNGDGVYGLRRALGLAGTRSQLMSLWKVDDGATRDLMTDYYQRLRVGQGRSHALRQAQLAMIQGSSGARAAASPAKARSAEVLGAEASAEPDLGRSHPYYWAAFIAAGDWRPIPPAVFSPGGAAKRAPGPAAKAPSPQP